MQSYWLFHFKKKILGKITWKFNDNYVYVEIGNVCDSVMPLINFRYSFSFLHFQPALFYKSKVNEMQQIILVKYKSGINPLF